MRYPALIVVAALLASPAFGADAPKKKKPGKPAAGAKQEYTPEQRAQIEKDIQALKPMRDFIGTWRGAGYPKKGSAEGAWGETADWAYDFYDARAGLAFDIAEGKYFTDGRIIPGKEPGTFTLIARAPGGKVDERYTGSFSDDKELVLEAEKPTDGRPKRITFSLIAHGARMVTLLEGRNKNSGQYVRLAEIGYTRKGSGFGVGGVGGRECVVTGGHAGSTVSYNGKEYGVCCTGCREEFDRDPEGVLKAYALRKEKEKAEAN